MAYDADLDSTHNPTVGGVAPAAWGDAINANFADMGTWTSYTPSWTGSSTNPVIGNGTLAGYYQRRGDFMIVRVRLTMGSTTTFGSGTWAWTTPVAFKGVYDLNGTATMLDSSGPSNYTGAVRGSSSTTMSILEHSVRSNVASTAPFTWATGDEIGLTATAQIA